MLPDPVARVVGPCERIRGTPLITINALSTFAPNVRVQKEMSMTAGIRDIFVEMSFGALELKVSSALLYALSLASEAEARLTVQAASVKFTLTHVLATSFARAAVADENLRLSALARAAAGNARALASLAGTHCKTETPHLPYGGVVDAAIKQARIHDLTVTAAEPALFSRERGMIEAVLLQSGRPMLLVPAGSERFRCKRVSVAWDGSAPATRAIHDALPLLKSADYVEILSIAGEKELSHTVPGAELAPHLAAHGVNATVLNLVAPDGDVANVLRRHAANVQLDMIVMGAYVHSRLQQTVLGGVTQSMLKSSPISLFLSH